MGRSNGYYKGYLEMNGFKTPFVVYAASAEHATKKALKNVGSRLEHAIIQDLEGPYYQMQL